MNKPTHKYWADTQAVPVLAYEESSPHPVLSRYRCCKTGKLLGDCDPRGRSNFSGAFVTKL